MEVTGSFVEIECGVDYHGAEDGYNRHATSVRVIVDKLGNALNPVWKHAWTQISPGIQTRGIERVTRAPGQEHVLQQCIRIRRSACPVHVQVHHTYDYVGYEDGDQHSSYEDWTRYYAADPAGSTGQ